MVKSAAQLGARLQAARHELGYSTRATARRLQEGGIAVSHTTLCNYEAGVSLPTTSAIAALSKIYGRPVYWFLGESQDLTGIRYRALKSVKVSEKRAFERESLRWLQAYLAADAITDEKVPRLKPFKIPVTETGESLAKRIRNQYKFEAFPIPSIARLAENFGIRVIQLSTASRIDGLAATLGVTPVIAVNSALSNDRMRMNIAHELAHHLFNDCLSGQRLGEEDLELRAMTCASHLIMPDTQLRDAFASNSMVRLVQYKERFGISLAAMIFRARKVNLISDSLYKQLWIEFGRLGWRRDEPGYVAPDRPVRMEAIFDSAIRTGKMTCKEIASLAGTDEYDVRQRILRAIGGAQPLGGGRNASGPYNFLHHLETQTQEKEM